MKNISISKLVSLYISCICGFMFISCSHNDEDKSQKGSLQNLSTKFYSELTFKQRLDALLLLSDNDTAKVCYALVMPKQTFKRLSKEETYPTSLAKTKTNDLYVNSVMSHGEYLDSLSKNDESKKDWLIHNSINEPINPIWEQIMEGK